MGKRKYLGNGTYGCVLKPPLDCRKNMHHVHTKTTHFVGKVFATKDVYETEKKSLIRIKTDVDPEGTFTLPLTNACQIRKPTARDLDPDAPEGCRYFRGDEYQVVYPDGGMDLHKYAEQYKDDPKAFIKLFKMMANVMQGLVKLSKRRIVHSDIKPQNMLLNSRVKRVSLIDFGLMLDYDELYRADMNSIKDANYMYFPLEFKLHVCKATTKEALLAAFNGSYNKSLFQAFNIDVDQELEAILATIEKGRYASKPIMYNRVDVFSMGMALADIMKTMRLLEGDPGSKADMLKLELIKDLVHHMIRLDARQRWDPNRVYERYQTILRLI